MRSRSGLRAQVCLVLGFASMLACGPGLEAPTSFDDPPRAIGVVASNAVTALESIVAVHVSENTPAVWNYSSWKSFHPVQFLEEALLADGTPFIEVSDADIVAGHLRDGGSGAPRYPILFSLGAEAVSDIEGLQIRGYVAAGGRAYVGSSSFTRYQDGTLRLGLNGKPMFALSDEMGLSPGSWTQTTTVVKVADHPMIDHLPFGASEWQMPRVYSFVDLWTPHWTFAAFPQSTAPATVLLTSQVPAHFQPSFANPPLVDNPTTAVFAWADVNGDKRADLVIRQGGSVYVRLSNGQGLLAPVLWSVWSTAYDFHLADVDGDGKADLVGRSGVDVQVGLSNGTTSFTTSTSWGPWSSSYDMMFADVDGDGDADIVGRLNGGADVQVGLSNGKAGGRTFAPSTSWGPWSSSYSMMFADVDGDGDADIVGRLNGGADVQVGLSSGKAGGRTFAPSTSWTPWGAAFTMTFADVDGDGDADIVGQSGTDIQVGLSTGAGHSFQPSTSWTVWSPDFTLDFPDVNGDGRSDVAGCKVASNAGTAQPLGDVEVGLSGGLGDATPVKLATKQFGLGKFIYNSEIVPLAGYGGFANDNSEYKTIRSSIEEAFSGTGRPLVTVAAWPFPHRAALIYRHDHLLAADIHLLEQQIAGASSSRPFGEYYIMPDFKNRVFQCSQLNDYTSAVPSVSSTGGMIGAHVINHAELDNMTGGAALSSLAMTKLQIEADTGMPMSPIFVAPTYRAVKQSSLLAIRDAGMLTTGEQGVGPFPHFTFDPETKGAYIGTVLQLPVSEWPGYDNMERMSISTDLILDAADLSYRLGGLVNVYDHAGGDPYAAGCTVTRAGLARLYLEHAVSLPTIWITDSLEIRDWWLRRDTVAASPFFTMTPGSSAIINVTMTPRAARGASTFSAEGLALRITLDPGSAALEPAGIRLTLDGVAQPGTSCSNSPRIVCADKELYVQVGSASQAVIRLGP